MQNNQGEKDPYRHRPPAALQKECKKLYRKYNTCYKNDILHLSLWQLGVIQQAWNL